MVGDTRSAPDADERMTIQEALSVVIPAAKAFVADVATRLHGSKYIQRVHDACDIVERTASSAGPTQEQPDADEYPYPDNPAQTHWEGCWRTRGHHNCAIDHIQRLAASSAEQPTADELASVLVEFCSSGHQAARAAHVVWALYRRTSDSPAAQPQVGAQQSSDEAPVG